jgi:hypothetical protein
MVDLKIIESPASIVKLHMYNWFQLKFCQKISSSNIIIVGSSPSCVKPKTLKLLFVANSRLSFPGSKSKDWLVRNKVNVELG